MMLSHDIIVILGNSKYYFCISNNVWFNVDYGILIDNVLVKLMSEIETLDREMTEYERKDKR